MLNPLMSGGAKIVEPLRDAGGRGSAHGAAGSRPSGAWRRSASAIRAVVDAYPFQLSGGMRQRVGIAAALARDPACDRGRAVDRARTSRRSSEILARLKAIQASRGGWDLILITHDLRVAFSMCDRVDVLYAGSVIEHGPASAVEEQPAHPYTLGLLLSEPPVDGRLAAAAGDRRRGRPRRRGRGVGARSPLAAAGANRSAS